MNTQSKSRSNSKLLKDFYKFAFTYRFANPEGARPKSKKDIAPMTEVMWPSPAARRGLSRLFGYDLSKFMPNKKGTFEIEAHLSKIRDDIFSTQYPTHKWGWLETEDVVHLLELYDEHEVILLNE